MGEIPPLLTRGRGGVGAQHLPRGRGGHTRSRAQATTTTTTTKHTNTNTNTNMNTITTKSTIITSMNASMINTARTNAMQAKRTCSLPHRARSNADVVSFFFLGGRPPGISSVRLVLDTCEYTWQRAVAAQMRAVSDQNSGIIAANMPAVKMAPGVRKRDRRDALARKAEGHGCTAPAERSERASSHPSPSPRSATLGRTRDVNRSQPNLQPLGTFHILVPKEITPSAAEL